MAHGYGLAHEFLERPSCALAFGVVTALLGAFMGISQWMLLSELPSQPNSVDISTLNETYSTNVEDPYWVSIENSRWDCGSITYKPVGKDTRTDFIATDPNEQTIIVVEFSEKLTCDEVLEKKPTGFLTQMSDRRFKVFSESGDFDLSRYKAPTHYYDLCAFCGRGNTSIGIIVSIAISISGLLLYPLTLRSYYKRYPYKRRIK